MILFSNHGRGLLSAAVAVFALVCVAGFALADTLTDTDLAALRSAGLSQETFVQALALYEDEGRTRPPAVDPAAVGEMTGAGFPDDLVRLVILLDRLTGDRPAMPVTPAAAVDLVKNGAGLDSVWLLVGNEIARAGGMPKIGTPAPTEEPGRDDTLGREVVTKPDGRKVIVYRSGKPSGPVEQVVTDADGKKWLVYRSAGPDETPVAMDPEQRGQIERALDQVLMHLHIRPR